MKVVDVNVLVYATDPHSPFHDKARAWWTGAANDPEPIGLPWAVLLACTQLFTSPSVFKRPMSVDTALATVETWLEWPQVEALSPKRGHLQRVRSLMHHAANAHGQRMDLLVTDAHIAALALELGGTVYSCDKGFSRFTEVRYRNPLE